MKGTGLLSIVAVLAVGLSACASVAAGTVKGQAVITTAIGGDQIELCSILPGTYSGGMPDVDWSNVTSQGWSAADGFDWRGGVVGRQGSSFRCILYGNRARFTTGSGGPFTITGAAAGTYALAVFMTDQSGRLVSGSDGTLLTIDLPADHGADVGSITVSK